MTITQRLADFAIATRSALPLRVRPRATRVVLDTLAVTLAGYPEPGPQALERTLHPSDDKHAVRIPWSEKRYRPEDACLLVGMAAHILDYDDVSMIAMCHPSVPILTALYVLAQQVPATGAQLLDAFAVGTEISIRSGQAMGFRHYDLGFHATATLGTLGAAAASSRLLGLSATRTCHALAIAASMSAGVRKNFGTMVKSLHVGFAASNGLRAARLAQAGLEGAEDAIGGRGWLYAFSGGHTEHWPHGIELGEPFAIDKPGFEQKRYPCCYMMHKIIQATLELRRVHGLSLDGLERAQVAMPRGGNAPLIYPLPSNGLAAKFSGPYAVVAGLADGRVDLASFEDDAVRRPEVQAALRTVRLTEAESVASHGSDVGAAPVSVTLTFSDGRRLSQTVVASPGSSEDPLADDELLEKWRDCMGRGLPGLPAGRVDRLFESGLKFDEQPDAGAWLASLGSNH